MARSWLYLSKHTTLYEKGPFPLATQSKYITYNPAQGDKIAPDDTGTIRLVSLLPPGFGAENNNQSYQKGASWTEGHYDGKNLLAFLLPSSHVEEHACLSIQALWTNW